MGVAAQFKVIAVLISIFALTFALARGNRLHGLTSLIGVTSEDVLKESLLVSVTPTKVVRVTSDIKLVSPSVVGVTAGIIDNKPLDSSVVGTGDISSSRAVSTVTPISVVGIPAPVTTTESPTLSPLPALGPIVTPISAKININTADKSELMTLWGIGESKSQAIIDYRIANGPFRAIDEIKDVKGIGDKTFEKIKDEITV